MWETKPAFVLPPPFSSPSRSPGPKHDGCQIPSLSFRMKAKDLFTAVRRRRKTIRPVTFSVSFQRRRCSSGTRQVHKEPSRLTVQQIEKSDLVSTQRG